MNQDQLRQRLIDLVALCAQYCSLCETAAEYDKSEFVDSMLGILPRLYGEFLDISTDDVVLLEEDNYFSSYVDEDYYDSVRRQIETVMGHDDVFLETFEEDMKYSDTPIAASIAESLADLFQPLYNFIAIVKDTDGDKLTEAYIDCRDDFASYWSQTLCNVLRALNHVKFNPQSNE